MPAKIPSVTCVTRLAMKLRRMREVYWLDASASATRVMENVMPITVIIEPASVDNNWRAPSGPAPNRRGHWVSQRLPPLESVSIKATAKTTLAATITDGMNQKLERRSLQICLSLCMVHPHFQFRISGMSWPFLAMYCLCSINLSLSCCLR